MEADHRMRLEKIGDVKCSVSQEDKLWKAIKCGVYKELYKRELVSDMQLSELLSHNMCTLDNEALNINHSMQKGGYDVRG